MPASVETLTQYLKTYEKDIYSIAESLAASIDLDDILKGKKKTIKRIFDIFPSIEMFYVIDENCQKITKTYFNPYESFSFKEDEDIEKNIIFRKFCKFIPNIHDIYIEKTIMFNPYTNNYVVEVFIPFEKDGKRYFLVLKFNLLKYLKIREVEEVRWFVNLSKISYGIVSFLLFAFAVAFVILTFYKVYKELYLLKTHTADIVIFKSVIYLTLALALVDLARQIFQYEIIYAEDPTKKIPLRKITARFLSTVLIAMAIETLLLVFKASILGEIKFDTVLYMAGAVFLILIGLSVYIYTGYKVDETKKKREEY